MSIFGAKPKKKKYPTLPPDPGFIVPEGQKYLEFLEEVHEHLQPEWYLEIGTQKGRSLHFAKGNCIAIDPKFMLEQQVIGDKKQLVMVQDTSDAFFDSGYLGRNEIKLDFAFLDGMHLFEYLLRDFMNTEAAAAKGAVVAMHDVVPWHRVMAKRTWSKAETNEWTGDVWKIIPILQRYRPDLSLQIMDCKPTGLAVVSNMDPASTVLADAYDEILEAFMDMTLDDIGVDAFFGSFEYTPAADTKSLVSNWTASA